tara:strand:+ start:1569 stop:2057 length:489 start_codon:yes stop_codon:yes gene_type:complete
VCQNERKVRAADDKNDEYLLSETKKKEFVLFFIWTCQLFVHIYYVLSSSSTDAEVYLGDEGWDCHFIVEREGDNMIRVYTLSQETFFFFFLFFFLSSPLLFIKILKLFSIVTPNISKLLQLRSQRLHYDYLRIPSPQRLDIGSLMEKAGDFYVISHPGEKVQ